MAAAFILGLVGASPVAAVKRRGGSKIFTVYQTAKYRLSVVGNYSMLFGEATESGTISAPRIDFTVLLKTRKPMPFAPEPGRVVALGRVVDQLRDVKGAVDCDLDAQIVYTMLVLPPVDVQSTAGVGEEGLDDELPPRLPLPVAVPFGKVGLSVFGAPEPESSGKIGVSKMCYFTEPNLTKEVSIPGVALLAALNKATEGGLIFRDIGGEIVRKSDGNPSYHLTFVLKKG